MPKFHFTYRVTHLPTGRFYLGKHTTAKMDDGYLGSGTIWLRILKAHPKDEFSRTVLQFFGSKDEVSDAERELITSDMLADPLCENLIPGGTGGSATNFWRNSSTAEISKKAAATLRNNPSKLATRNIRLGIAHKTRLQADPAALNSNLTKMHTKTRGSVKATTSWIQRQVASRRQNHMVKMGEIFSKLLTINNQPVAEIVNTLGVSRSTVMRMRAMIRRGETSWSAVT